MSSLEKCRDAICLATCLALSLLMGCSKKEATPRSVPNRHSRRRFRRSLWFVLEAF